MTTLIRYLEARYIPARLSLTEGSAEQLRVAVRRYRAHLGHEPLLSDLEPQAVVSWLRALTATRAPCTVNSKRRQILALWNDAADAGLVEPPPRRGLPKVLEPLKIPEAFTTNQLTRLKRACRRARGNWSGLPAALAWEIAVLVLWDTAARVGSLLAARVVDVDLDRATWFVPARNLKGRRADRIFKLHRETAGLIRQSVQEWPRRELLFPFPYNKRRLWNHFRRILKDAGLPHSRRHMFHCLRRSSESYAAASIGVAAAAELVGHSEAIARRHYVCPSIAGERSLVDVLPRI